MSLDRVMQQEVKKPTEAEVTRNRIAFYERAIGHDTTERCKRTAEGMSSEEAALIHGMTREEYFNDNYFRLLGREYLEYLRRDLK